MLSNSAASIDVCGCIHADQNVCVAIRKPEDCKLHLQQNSLVVYKPPDMSTIYH